MSSYFLYLMELGLLDDKLKAEHRPYLCIYICPHPAAPYLIQLSTPVYILSGSFDPITENAFLMGIRFKYMDEAVFEGGHRIPVYSSRIQRLINDFVNKYKKFKIKIREPDKAKAYAML